MARERDTVVSYNVHGCRGSDGRHDIDRCVDVIDGLRPLVVGLQEVDSREGRDGWRAFEDGLGMHALPGHTLSERDGHYGNLLLTRCPVLDAVSCDLGYRWREPRRAIDALLDVPGGPLRVIVTHLGLARRERRVQLERLGEALAARWQGHRTVLLGDFNEWLHPRRVGRALGRPLFAHALPRTFPARAPCFALDQIWCTPRGLVRSVRAVAGATARRASDHLPLAGTLALTSGEGGDGNVADLASRLFDDPQDPS